MSKETIYIAGRFHLRELFRPHREALLELGYKCTSSWLDLPIGAQSVPESEEQQMREAVVDLDQVGKSKFLVVDMTGTGGGGRFFEMGYAFAKNIMIFVVGAKQQVVFECLIARRFDNWQDCLAWFAARERA